MSKGLFENVYNPDVLTCISNLSSDEVFTSPSIANLMLNMLPQEIFSNPDTRILDPACKSGVFLREAAKRFDKGLEKQIPDREQRFDHIFKKQLFGIAITELTSLISRRSVYCSAYPNSKYSVAKFDDTHADGNIRFKRIEHLWKDGKCSWCGAAQAQYDRSEDNETHAYEFIHCDPKELYDMKFDVIISNPPYQLSTAGDDNGAQAKPLYQDFVQTAIKLKPHYIVMITPSRWFSGGWGLDEFRQEMISCNHIQELHDFQNSSDCFSGVEIKGGISYFLYNKDYNGMCAFYSHSGDEITSKSIRFLKEKGCDILIRYNDLISIYRKAYSEKAPSFSSIVSGRSPFGFNTNHVGNQNKTSPNDLKYFERKGFTYMSRSKVSRGADDIPKYKLFIPKAAEDGKIPGKVIGNITEGAPDTICSGTYLMVGPFSSKEEMKNAKSYMVTKFFRALVAINKISQNASYKVYETVPMQDFSKPWTDEELYAKYNLTQEEIDFIESMIKPMEIGGDDNG